jgi:hypothetical protein
MSKKYLFIEKFCPFKEITCCDKCYFDKRIKCLYGVNKNKMPLKCPLPVIVEKRDNQICIFKESEDAEV